MNVLALGMAASFKDYLARNTLTCVVLPTSCAEHRCRARLNRTECAPNICVTENITGLGHVFGLVGDISGGVCTETALK